MVCLAKVEGLTSARNLCQKNQLTQINTVNFDFLEVVSEDIFTTLDIRKRDIDDFIKSSRSFNGRINSFREVGSTKNNDIISLFETIYLKKIYSLIHFFTHPFLPRFD